MKTRKNFKKRRRTRKNLMKGGGKTIEAMREVLKVIKDFKSKIEKHGCGDDEKNKSAVEEFLSFIVKQSEIIKNAENAISYLEKGKRFWSFIRNKSKEKEKDENRKLFIKLVNILNRSVGIKIDLTDVLNGKKINSDEFESMTLDSKKFETMRQNAIEKIKKYNGTKLFEFLCHSDNVSFEYDARVIGIFSKYDVDELVSKIKNNEKLAFQDLSDSRELIERIQQKISIENITEVETSIKTKVESVLNHLEAAIQEYNKINMSVKSAIGKPEYRILCELLENAGRLLVKIDKYYKEIKEIYNSVLHSMNTRYTPQKGESTTTERAPGADATTERAPGADATTETAPGAGADATTETAPGAGAGQEINKLEQEALSELEEHGLSKSNSKAPKRFLEEKGTLFPLFRGRGGTKNKKQKTKKQKTKKQKTKKQKNKKNE